jgi:hypothetical protein
LINGFVPTPGSTFEIMTFGSRSGDVAVLGAPGSTGLALSKTWTANSLVVTINPALAGDANYDGIVNSADLARLAMAWQSTGNWTNGDFTGDSRVNLLDLIVLATHWQNALPAAPLGEQLDALGLPQVNVPDPGGASTLGLLGLALARRRGRKKKGTSCLAQRQNIPVLACPPIKNRTF